MKALTTTAYGTPDVLQIRDIPVPEPKAGEVRVRAHAGVVSAADIAFRKGDPFIVRLIYGLRKPRILAQGVEFSGVIDTVGEGVTGFKPGDRVMGMSPDKFGANAEYLCLPVKKPLAHMPRKASFEEAAALVEASTALTFLKRAAKIQPGQRVLINGASGAVGAYGVQIAKLLGAHVTAVCSGANADLVRGLGADAVIDYTTTNFTTTGQTWDVIFDAVGKRSYGQCARALTPDGQYLTTVPTLGMLWDLLRTLPTRQKAKFVTAGLMQSEASLNELVALFDAGTLRAVIDRTYPIERAAEAHAYVESGRKKGVVVLCVG